MHAGRGTDLLRKLSAKWDKFERRTTKKFNKREKLLWNVFVFVTRFALLAVPFQIILWTNFDAYQLQILVAKAVSYLLSVSGVNVIRADNFIYVKAPALWAIEIIKDCVGWKSYLALGGLMFAVRGISLKSRLWGMVAGAPVIFFGNIFRIYTSIYASLLLGTGSFSVIHDFLWQAGMMLLILGTWIVWLKSSDQRS